MNIPVKISKMQIMDFASYNDNSLKDDIFLKFRIITIAQAHPEIKVLACVL
jgi:hypothetical protein